MELLHAKFNENHKANNQLLSQQKIASQMPRGTRIDSTGKNKRLIKKKPSFSIQITRLISF